MEIKRRREIVIETTRRIVAGPTATGEIYICGDCGKLMVAAENLAALHGIGRRIVYRIAEDAGPHAVENDAGILLVCHEWFASEYSRRERSPQENLSKESR